MSDNDLVSLEFWLRATAPSIPSVVTVIVGFYVHHKTALLRQKRQEAHDRIEWIKTQVEKVNEPPRECWTLTGKQAASQGKVNTLRGFIQILDVNFHGLILLNPSFLNAREKYFVYKNALDEYKQESDVFSIQDVRRQKGMFERTSIYRDSAHFLIELTRVFQKNP